jgi:hypothetical protein
MLTFAAALAVAVPPLIPAEPKPVDRPPAELHCIYDETPAATREEIGRLFWLMDGSPHDVGVAVSGLFSAPVDTCRFRHAWNAPEMTLALNYAQGVALSHYGRGRLRALHIDTSRLEDLYWAVPGAARLAEEAHAVTASLVRELLGHPRAYAGDPRIQEHAATYLQALAMIERAERMWAEFPPVSGPFS